MADKKGQMEHETSIHKKLNDNKVPNVLKLHAVYRLSGKNKLDIFHQKYETDLFVKNNE